MDIKSIRIELLTLNIIVESYNEMSQQSLIRGFSPNNIEDWEMIDGMPDVVPYRDIAWSSKVRPINNNY